MSECDWEHISTESAFYKGKVYNCYAFVCHVHDHIKRITSTPNDEQPVKGEDNV